MKKKTPSQGGPLDKRLSNAWHLLDVAAAHRLKEDVARRARASKQYPTARVWAKVPNDTRLSEPGRIDRYLPFSGEVPDGCRLPKGKPNEADALPDEPIVGEAALEAALGSSLSFPTCVDKPLGAFPGVVGKPLGAFLGVDGKPPTVPPRESRGLACAYT